MIIRTEKIVEALEVTEMKACERCKEGEMIKTGVILLSYPEKYEHKCNECGNIQAYDSMYPKKFLEKR